MRHMKRVKKLGRDKEHRLSLFRNQVISLLKTGRIKTTLPKAKATRQWVEKMITLAKKAAREDRPERKFALRRTARKFIVDRTVTNWLFDEFPAIFEDREGGYTRIYRLGPRRGDGAEMAILELVAFPEKSFKDYYIKGKKHRARKVAG